MLINFKKLHPDARLPEFAHPTDSCADLRCVCSFSLAPGERRLVPIGLAIDLPNGYGAQIRPRSGLAAKHGVTVLNSPGTIDNDYTGELQVILINHGQNTFFGIMGDKIAQLYIEQIPKLDFAFTQQIDLTDRGEGGFGSTGR